MQAQSLAGVLRRPVVVAPMGGGPSTVELVVAAAEARALGFLAAGYKTAQAMAAEIAETRAGTSEPFGVNVFVPGEPSQDVRGIARYLESLEGDATAVGASLGEPRWDDDAYQPKIDELLVNPPAVVSFAFGCPDPEVIGALEGAGAVVAVTVTSPEEAVVAAAAGAAALCVQGSEAGAHRGTFKNDGAPRRDHGLLALIGEVARVTDLPQIAAGGIMGRKDVTAALQAGAVAAQCGTAFLRCPESGAHPLYKAALVDPRYNSTVVTRAFSGRPARGLVNQFILGHADAPAAYPEINNATRPMRAAAAANRDPERMSLWAGTGFASARHLPAAEIVEMLCPDARANG